MRALQRFTVTTAIGLLALLSAGHQASAQIKIGAVLSVTGPASFLGDPEKKTLEMYVEDINATGGVSGQKLQLIVYDDAQASEALTFAKR
jgi:branched-chain amino acid transport system substrate-binding protein